MRVIRWKNAVTGVESLNITATGIYFPVGKTDSSFIARYSMASAGQTASVERVSSPNGSRVGSPAINVSGTTEVVVNERRGLSTGIIVTAISGTLISVLDDNTPITNFPDAGLGRFPAKEDADAYVYGSTVPQGIPAIINGVPYSWGGAEWGAVGGGGNSNGSSSAPFASTTLRDAWALSNLGALTIGQRVFAFFDGTSIEYSWGGGSAINWIPVFSASENIHVGARKNIIAARALTTRAPRYLFYGDSNLAGEGAGTGVNGMFGARDMSFPVVMAKRLGWQTGSFFGDGNSASIGTFPNQYDPRIVTGSWVTTSPETFGARWLQSSWASTQDLVFTPEGVCDRIAIWSARGAAYSMNMEVRVDGVVVGNISLRSPSSGYIPITYTVPLGAHVVSIRNIDTNTANVCGIETWDSTSKAPRLLHAGYCGANLATLDVVTSPYSPMSAILALAPDAATLHCTITDIGQSTAIASIAASISSMANRLEAINCDVIHTVSFASNHDRSIDGTLGVFADILRQTALGYGGAFADSRDILGATYAITAAKGVTFNGDHLLAEGYRLQSLHFAKLFA